MSVCVMLVAAEASGDQLGADLIRALRRRLGPGARFVGLGGPAMAAEGVASPFDISELSVVGLLEGLLAARRAARRAEELAELAERERPDLAVLIDSWGFSYLTARSLRRRLPGLKLVKYVLPQVWASRPKRARTAARRFDLLLSIIAFEAPLFAREGGRVVFVGHPAAGRSFATADPARLRARIGAGPDDPILLVLPGSRPAEVARLMAPFGEAVRRLAAGRPSLRVVLAAAPTVAEAVRARTGAWPVKPFLIEDAEGKDDAFAAATVALACSGTVTTELAAAGCPMVVAYRLGAVTYQIALRIVRTRYITLFNIAADAPIAPELIQGACTGAALARELALRLDDPDLRARQAAAQTAALERLGRGGPAPAERAAEAIADLLRISAAGR
jgi:lipid-A-disaccharide synthase